MLAGPGKWLQVDRVTQLVFIDASAPSFKVPEIESEEFQSPMLSVPAKIQTSKDAYENLSKIDNRDHTPDFSIIL